MITYTNGRFRSSRPVDETGRLLQEELKKLSPKNRAAIDLLLKDTVLNKTNRVVDQAERFQWDPSTGPAVPIRQWVNDRHLLGETAETLFPMLKEDMIELFEGDYYECILCLHPDTAIPLLDGSSATIRELADRWKSNQTPFWVYGIKDGAVVPVLALEPRQTGVDDYFKVTLDDGSSFTGNARHQMIMRDGSKRMIRDMAPGDSIMPFDVRLSERPSDRISGYEQVRHPESGEWVMTHRLVAESLCPKDDSAKTVVHHKNFNKLDNRPSNLDWMAWSDHRGLHSRVTVEWRAANPEKAAEVDKLLYDGLVRRWTSPDSWQERERFSTSLKERLATGLAIKAGKLSWKNRCPQAKKSSSEKLIQRNRSIRRTRDDVNLETITTTHRAGNRTLKSVARALNCSPNCVRLALRAAGLSVATFFGSTRSRPTIQTRLVNGGSCYSPPVLVKKTPDPSAAPVFSRSIALKDIKAAVSAGSLTVGAVATRLGCGRSTIRRVLAEHGLTWWRLRGRKRNHHVVSIEPVGRGPVYCMTVPETTNFAITTSYSGKEANPTRRAGVFSSNTGGTRWG